MSDQPATRLTDDIKALIGTESDWSELSEPISAERLRRFLQAIMENDRLFWDEDYARGTKYGDVVSPPLFMAYGLNRRQPRTPDPLDAFADDPAWDAFGPWGLQETGGGSRPLASLAHLGRMVNGGTSAEFFRLVSPGDQLKAQGRYDDIVERQGRDGPMIIATTQTTYRNQNNELVAIIRSTSIYR